MRHFILFIAAWTLIQSTCTFADSGYPKLKLDNGEFEVSIYLPDASRGYYRGTRFDWSGIIERVNYQGHRFYSPLHEIHDPLKHDSLSGPAVEFAMFHPMGFAEAEAGESFIKIGVGLLAKSESLEYQFYGKYQIIRAGEWAIKHGPDWVIFSQNLRGDRGWAYRYRKTIRLVPGYPEFVIEQHLENTGEKTIDINHYNHNFTLIDEVPYGPDYSVEFPFSTATPQLIKELAWFRDNTIKVVKPLGKKSLRIPVYEGEGRSDYNAAVVRNNRTGAAIVFKGDAPIDRMVFWAVERAACPEPFIRVFLTPGQAQEWTSRYRFVVDAN